MVHLMQLSALNRSRRFVPEGALILALEWRKIKKLIYILVIAHGLNQEENKKDFPQAEFMN